METNGGTSTKRTCLLFISGVLLLATGGIMIPVVDMLYKAKIRDTAIIANGSEFWKEWVSPSVPIYMQFYMFNVTNPEEVKAGQKPNLTQQGPYTYRETREKVDIEFIGNGTVMYRERYRYFFQSNMSAGNETDLVTTGNPVVMTAANVLQYAIPAARTFASTVLATAKQDLFLTRSVRDLLWGYTDKDLQRLSTTYPDWIPSPLVGYFLHRNDTNSGLMNVFTGINTVENVGQIDRYNGSKRMPYWSTPWANEINGTDGTRFPPFQQGSESLEVFSAEICRSLKVVYKKPVKTRQGGVMLRRFVISEKNLQNSTANPDNLGFCIPQTKCLPSGLLNLTSCVLGSENVAVPVVASWPHFYQADPVVRHSVEGLNPVKEDHETVLDIEPNTGMVLQGYRRLQINMHVMKLDRFIQTYNIPTMYFPIFWMNEMVEIDNDQVTRLQRDFFAPMEISKVLEKVFMILGGALVLAVMVLVCRNRRQNKKWILAPGPVPNELTNGGAPMTRPGGRRNGPKRGNGGGGGHGGHKAKETQPLLSDHHSGGAGDHHGSMPPSPPPSGHGARVPSYQRPPVNNNAGQYQEPNQHLSSVAACVEPVYQMALDA